MPNKIRFRLMKSDRPRTTVCLTPLMEQQCSFTLLFSKHSVFIAFLYPISSRVHSTQDIIAGNVRSCLDNCRSKTGRCKQIQDLTALFDDCREHLTIHLPKELTTRVKEGPFLYRCLELAARTLQFIRSAFNLKHWLYWHASQPRC